MFKEPSFPTAEQRITKEEAAKLSIELSESHEVFPFPGIDEAAYVSLKAVDDEYPGIATPIDSLIVRFTAHGMRFFLGERDPNSDEIWIVPGDNAAIEEDYVLARHLKIIDAMDPRLKRLVLYGRALVESKKG